MSKKEPCKYCKIFGDLESMTCPNCGRLLSGSERE